MKKLLSMLAVVATLSPAWAQLPDGSIAPDFTMTDIYGETHNLYSYLDQGMSVILNFSAVWCGPCLDYKESGVLNDIYNAFGPEGSGDIMVLSFETEDQLGIEALYGNGGGTVGDFVTGTNYPIIDNADNLYWNSYMQPNPEVGPVPLIYTVCPNGTLTETGQATLQTHVSIATSGCGNAVTNPAATLNYSGDESNCGEGQWEAKVDLTNLGSIPVTSATFEVDFNGNTTTFDWSGNLTSGASVTTDVGEYNNPGNLNVKLAELNGAPRNSSTTADITGSIQSTDMLIVKITPDCFCMPNILGAGETSWEVRNENGVVIESVDFDDNTAPGTGGPYQAGVEYTWQVDLPSYGCYTFQMIDAYGDGLNGCQYTGNDCFTCGSARVWSYNGTTQVSTLLNFDGADIANGGNDVAFSDLVVPFEVTSTSTNLQEFGVDETFAVYPNPTNGDAQLIYTLQQPSNVQVTVTNALGQQVQFIQLGSLPAGEHRTSIDLNNLQAGMYNVILRADNRVKTIRTTKL